LLRHTLCVSLDKSYGRAAMASVRSLTFPLKYFGRYQTFTRWAGGRYRAWPGWTSKAVYQASRLRTV